LSWALLLQVVTNAVTRGKRRGSEWWAGENRRARMARCKLVQHACRPPVATTTAACSIDARQQSRPLSPVTETFTRISSGRPLPAEAGEHVIEELLPPSEFGAKKNNK
jgi:hypothetical protein